MSFDDLAIALVKRFASGATNWRLRQTLAQRVQSENESVADYAGSLRKLFALLNLLRTEWMHKFVFGLKKEISEYVILHKPDDFEKAEELALLREAVMDEKLCFSKEAPAFDAKDISQALEKVISPEVDRSRVDNVLSLLGANVSKSLAEQMIEPSLVNSMNCSNV